jgi:hypothetical protein
MTIVELDIRVIGVALEGIRLGCLLVLRIRVRGQTGSMACCILPALPFGRLSLHRFAQSVDAPCSGSRRVIIVPVVLVTLAALQLRTSGAGACHVPEHQADVPLGMLSDIAVMKWSRIVGCGTDHRSLEADTTSSGSIAT